MAQSDPTAPSLSSQLVAPARCPDVEDWMSFALGKLAPGRLEAVHEHLDVCAACQRVLADAAHALATAVTAEGAARDDVEWNTTFQRGALVGGRYEIREFIARGGMGEVYEAFNRELRERVALKTVSSTACDNLRAVKRLKGEVQLARRVSHPNVCRIYDFGSHRLATTGAQLYFLTMEFVEGETLGQRVRLAGELPEAEARKVARELLLGLGAAHEAGVLHRDFKSDNVMLKVGPDGQSTAVVLDFGLARALENQDRASGSNSQVVGTFGYIAPEQLDGRPHTTASDVYAFGVVWFEMLTGELPYRSTASSGVSALRALERPPAPSRLNRSVPAEIDALVLRCLERAPGARYQGVGEILSRLDALAASSESPQGRRRRMGVALVACLGLAVLYFFAGTRPLARTTVRTTSTSTSTSVVGPLPTLAPAEQSVAKPPPSARAAEGVSGLAQAPLAPAAAPPLRRANAASNRTRALQAPSPPDGATAALAPPPADARAAPSSEPAQSGAISHPSSLSPSAYPPAAPAVPPTQTRPHKPDWENPFSALEAQLVLRAKGAT